MSQEMKQQKFTLIKAYPSEIENQVQSEIEMMTNSGWYIKSITHATENFNAKNKQGEEFLATKHYYSIVFEKES